MRTAARSIRITLRGVAATLLIFGVAGACVWLGFWQLDRLAQRRERNVQLRARLEAPPVWLASAPRDSTGWLHRRVMLDGRFDNERTIVLPGRLFEGMPGAHLLTPVLMQDGGALLVDRGWVPAADGATVDIAALQLEAATTDSALVLEFPGQEKRLGRMPNTPARSHVARRDSQFRRVWFATDESALREQFPYRLGAIHVRLLPRTNATGLPQREPAPALQDGPHLGYAIQWFSFAVIALAGWLVIVMKQARPASSRPVGSADS